MMSGDADYRDNKRIDPLHSACVEQLAAAGNILKLVEEQKEEKKEAQKKIFELETLLKIKELEVKLYENVVQVLMRNGDDHERKKIIEDLDRQITELKQSNNDLINKRGSNDELEEAFKELIMEIVCLDDERLLTLISEWGEKLCAVLSTVFDEYHPGGREVTSQDWRLQLGRRPTLKEVIFRITDVIMFFSLRQQFRGFFLS